jgi:hypothetical protein
MLQAVVLPSNASPLRDGHEHRVLQEHSGNSQQTSYSYGNGFEQKYPASLLNENTFPFHDSHGQALYPQHSRPSAQHGSINYNGGPQNDVYILTPEEEAQIEHDAKVLWRRFSCSEGYAKYRQRQHKGTKKDEQKWPDDLEQAFFHGTKLVATKRRTAAD